MNSWIQRSLLLLLVVLSVTSCSKGARDVYKNYRQYSEEQLYHLARADLVRHRYQGAEQKFEALNALYPFGPDAEQSELDLIYADYRNDSGPSAVAAAERYISLYPRSAHVDYAYYMKGVISFEQGLPWAERKLGVDPALRDLSNKKEAFFAFNDLVTYFPDSPYAPDALARMSYIRNTIARHNVVVAKYYLERKAYVAAVNRASYVIQHFEGSPQVIPALAVMVRAYRGLGLHHLADNALTVLRLSYPDAPELKRLAYEKKFHHA